MRWNSFPTGLLFALMAALAFFPAIWTLAPYLGYATAASGFILFVVSVYVVGLAPDWRRGVRAGLLASALGIAVCLLASSLPEAAVGATVVLALCRSGYLYRQRFARSLVTELGLGVAALVAAALAAGPSTMSLALATWVYLLVQSAFFLVTPRRVSKPRAFQDPFESATSRATEIMDQI